ncbi:MAG TPA: Uma2 family endonuclease [Pyrinomonadaceae bacterium]|nr:Uma2 family endonuclease [Pyrinomonadaceae bacterium]
MQVIDAPATSPMSFSPLVRQYTLEEFWALPEPEGRSHYELIGGYLFMVPPPDWPHEDVDARMNRWLVLFLEAQGSRGNVYHPQAPIYTNDTYLEPDMMYVSNELGQEMGQRRTSADIVFEYFSKSSAIYDRTTKADTYLALGVQELWLIDSDSVTIEVRHRIIKDSFPVWEIVRYEKGEVAESRALNGWRVSVDELFAGLV